MAPRHTSASTQGTSKGGLCSREACNIQTCLSNSNYDQGACGVEMDQLKRCCEQAGEHKPVHCALFDTTESKPSGTGEKDSPGEASPSTMKGNYKRESQI